jgi:hypothetical protein
MTPVDSQIVEVSFRSGSARGGNWSCGSDLIQCLTSVSIAQLQQPTGAAQVGAQQLGAGQQSLLWQRLCPRPLKSPRPLKRPRRCPQWVSGQQLVSGQQAGAAQAGAAQAGAQAGAAQAGAQAGAAQPQALSTQQFCVGAQQLGPTSQQPLFL